MLLLLLLSLLLLTLCARQAGTFDFILRNKRKIKREMCVKLILVDLSFVLVPSMGLGTSASDTSCSDTDLDTGHDARSPDQGTQSVHCKMQSHQISHKPKSFTHSQRVDR